MSSAVLNQTSNELRKALAFQIGFTSKDSIERLDRIRKLDADFSNCHGLATTRAQGIFRACAKLWWYLARSEFLYQLS